MSFKSPFGVFAPLYADWNKSNFSLFPTCKYALPGSVISAARGVFNTSLLSSFVCTFRQSLNLELLHICASTTPEGFCVASIRCTPKLRPILAADINSFINSGYSIFNSANSSTMIIKCGSGVMSLFCLYISIYSSMWFTFWSANNSCLFFNSAFIDFNDLCISLPSTLVIDPIRWGKFFNWFTIPPPLKSIIKNPNS